jgi:FixJ family two-component response regulator
MVIHGFRNQQNVPAKNYNCNAKPFRDQDLLDAVQVALERARSWHESEKAVSELRAKFETLTHREKEVMAGVTGGLSSTSKLLPNSE